MLAFALALDAQKQSPIHPVVKTLSGAQMDGLVKVTVTLESSGATSFELSSKYTGIG